MTEERKEFEYNNDIIAFGKLVGKMQDTFQKKRKDYGPSTRDTYEKFGMVSMLVRMHDKMARLENLTMSKEGPAVDESIEDTLLDLANYAVIAIIEKHYFDNMKTKEGD